MNACDHSHDERDAVATAQDDAEESVGCPKCGGPAVYLGVLGSLADFRCIDCGWSFQFEVSP